MTITSWNFLVNLSRAIAYQHIVESLQIKNEEAALSLDDNNHLTYNLAVIEKIDTFYNWKTCQEFLFRYIIKEDGDDVEYDADKMIQKAYPALEKDMIQALFKHMSDKGELTLCWDAKRNDFVYVKAE